MREEARPNGRHWWYDEESEPDFPHFMNDGYAPPDWDLLVTLDMTESSSEQETS